MSDVPILQNPYCPYDGKRLVLDNDDADEPVSWCQECQWEIQGVPA